LRSKFCRITFDTQNTENTTHKNISLELLGVNKGLDISIVTSQKKRNLLLFLERLSRL
jgi:hypothetical protein